jgi:hypothetical protein
MAIKELRWLFLAVLAAALFSLNLLNEPVTYGISQQWTNGSYRFAGGTHPVALAFSLVVLFLYLLLMLGPPPTLRNPLPGVFRRFLAFWVDFILAMMAIAPIMGILPALAEWRRIGHFEWNFERTT